MKWFKERFVVWLFKRGGKETHAISDDWVRDLFDALDEPLVDLPKKLSKHGSIGDKSLIQLIAEHMHRFGTAGPLIMRCIRAFQNEFNKKGD